MALTDSYIFVFGAFFYMKCWDPIPNSYGSRFVFLLILISGVLVFYHWEAMLISYLAVVTNKLPFRSMEELMTNGNQKVTLIVIFMDESNYVEHFYLRFWSGKELHMKTCSSMPMTLCLQRCGMNESVQILLNTQK